MPTPPVGYSSFLTYMGNGEYNPYLPNPTVENCDVTGVCASDYFGRVIQKRTPAQEQAVIAQALNYFNWKFGINLQDPEIAASVMLIPFTLDPRLNYRAYVMSGKETPPEGHQVRDGGWAIVLLTEMTLGGEFAGKTYPAQTLLIFGENNIFIDRVGTKNDEEVVISYRFQNPVVPDINGNATATIELRQGKLLQNNFGSQSVPATGLAQLTIGQPLVDYTTGTIKAKMRTVLTFSAKGGY